MEISKLTEKERAELLNKNPEDTTPSLYYKFSAYKYNTESKPRVLSGIEELDYLTKGFEMGCITIWTGLTNAGKTTVMTMITKQTIMQGHKVFYFNGEQTKDDFKNNLYKQSVDRKDIYEKQYMQNGKGTCVFDYFVKTDKAKELDKIYGENLIVYNNNAKRTIDFLLMAMNEVLVKYGVKVFMLDNFMQIDTTSSDEYREQKDIMEKLRTFAVTKGVHIHLVAHPRKTDKMQTRLTIYDVLGSSNLVNKAYNVISIIRVDNLDKNGNEYKRLQKQMFEAHYDIAKTSTILEILKTKGIACGLVGLQYDSFTKTFREQGKITSELYEKMKKQNVQEAEGESEQFELPW